MPRLPALLRRSLVWSGSTLGGLVVVLLVSLLIPGCAVGYVTRQSMTHMHVLIARQPVEKAIARGRVSEEWRGKIEIIGEARDFGVDRLALPAGDLYRTISLIHPDPNWVVTASEKDALQPVTWWFPIVGRVAYRGYYDRADAERFAGKLRRRDLDVLVRPADAFSTLGWFADPIRPAMLDRGEASLANLVLHEAAHRVVYLKGQTDFNESFASFVGDAGTLLYLEDRYGEGCPLCRRTGAAYADGATFSAFLQELVADLQRLYDRPLSREEKIRQREEVFATARERFGETSWRGDSYAWFAGSHLDNAVVLSLRRYEADRHLFDRLLQRCDGDLSRSIALVHDLGWSKLPRKERRLTDPFTLLERHLDASDPCPPAP